MTTTKTHNELARLFADEDAAREHLENLRWANGVVCPHCGVKDQATKLQPKEGSKRPARKGVWKCRACRKQFTVTVGTIFEASHIPLNKWLHVFHLVCSSKKGMSAHQIHRITGVAYKSAWFMVHRIREAMTPAEQQPKLDGTVEVDETYVGGKHHGTGGRGSENKTIVILTVQRDGESRAKKIPHVTGENVKGFIRENVDKDAVVNTDSFSAYTNLNWEYEHQVVDHSKGEYARGLAHTNTAESWFSLLKRGVIGTFHHISAKHMDRYTSEFAYRWNYRKVSDYERTIAAIRIAGGKRLKYKDLIAK
jgi:transposase-like protein